MESPPLIYAALSAVQHDIAKIGISKSSENKMQGFKFRGIDAMYNALAPILGRHGVVIIPSVVGFERTTLTTANGKASYQTLVTVDYSAYAKDGSSIIGRGVGEAQDTGDKSMSKALTMALKYFLIHSLAIPLEREVDPDSETYEAAAFCTQEQSDELRELIEETGTDINRVLAAYTVPGNPLITSLTQIPGAWFDKAKKALISKRKSA